MPQMHAHTHTHTHAHARADTYECALVHATPCMHVLSHFSAISRVPLLPRARAVLVTRWRWWMRRTRSSTTSGWTRCSSS